MQQNNLSYKTNKQMKENKVKKLWRHRHRRGRPWKDRNVEFTPTVNYFSPAVLLNDVPITLYEDELEALRLVDLQDLTQEEAGKMMNISRGTIWRLLKEGRKKIIRMLIEGRPLQIKPKTAVEIEKLK